MRLAGVTDVAVGQVDAKDADRDVDEEDQAPVQIGGDEPAEQRPHGGAEHGGQREVVHRADEFGAAYRAEDDDPADRHHHRAAYALDESRERERDQRGGRRAQEGAGDKDADSETEDRARAEAVGDPAADRDEDPEAEHITGDGDLQRDGVPAESFGHFGDRGDDDVGIDAFHEHRAGDDERGNESFDG